MTIHSFKELCCEAEKSNRAVWVEGGFVVKMGACLYANENESTGKGTLIF